MARLAGCDDPPTVVVAMLTYLRPHDLEEALPALLVHIDDSGVHASILVVDNDPNAGAMQVAERFQPERVRFVHEPQAGIAAARNKALEESGDADLLVFIDDDERPEPGWLDALVTTWRSTGAAAVTGPVSSIYAVDPDPWIEAGAFFQRRRLITGTAVNMFATNNVLLDLAQVRRAGVRFDERFGVSGGSDVLFSRQLHRSGGELVWCAEARVVDVVPASRLNRRWVLQRALRSGNTWSRTTLALEPRLVPRLGWRVLLTVRGAVRLTWGGLRAAVGVVSRSPSHQARGARTFARGLGVAAGAWGYSYSEYKRKVS